VTRKVLRVNLYDLVAKGTALLGFLLFDRAAVEPTGWIRFLPTVAMMRSGLRLDPQHYPQNSNRDAERRGQSADDLRLRLHVSSP